MADVQPARDRRRFDLLAILLALMGVLVALCIAVPGRA
jgi:hypothetical protein